MKKLSILLCCCFFAVSMPAMEYKLELLARLKGHFVRLDRDAVAMTLLSGGVVVSRIYAQACEGQDYCFIARAIPMLPGLGVLTYNLIQEYRENK